MKGGWHTGIVMGLLLALAAALVLALRADGEARRLRTCTGLEVEFADSLRFVSTEDVRECLETSYGRYIGQRLDSVDLAKVERVLDSRSAILHSEAYTTPDGVLHVIITQRKPVIRFQRGDDGFYADAEGFMFPLHPRYRCDVPVVDGYVPLWHGGSYRGMPQGQAETTWMRDILDMMRTISADKVWRRDIVQVSVGKNGDLILVPREGDERFIFGNPSDAKKKLVRMAKYYEYIRPAVGEDCYKTVIVKYDGQVICRKDRI